VLAPVAVAVADAVAEPLGHTALAVADAEDDAEELADADARNAGAEEGEGCGDAVASLVAPSSPRCKTVRPRLEIRGKGRLLFN